MPLSASEKLSLSAKAALNVPFTTLCAYAGFIVVSWCTYDLVGGREWTSILTLSATTHFWGRILLWVQVCVVLSYKRSKRVACIHYWECCWYFSKSLTLDSLALALRLSSTLCFHGYLPSDVSGDYLYQCTDLCSLAMNGSLLHTVLFSKRSTYQEDDDDMSLGPLVIICIILGFCLHS